MARLEADRAYRNPKAILAAFIGAGKVRLAEELDAYRPHLGIAHGKVRVVGS